MSEPTPFKQLIFRAVLRNVSPMVIRVLAVPDYLDLRRSTRYSAPYWAGMDRVSSSGFTGRSTTVFGGERARKHCATSNCAGRKSFSTRAAPSTCGSEKSGFSTTSRASIADLLKEVLPVGPSTNHETVREHLQ